MLQGIGCDSATLAAAYGNPSAVAVYRTTIPEVNALQIPDWTFFSGPSTPPLAVSGDESVFLTVVDGAFPVSAVIADPTLVEGATLPPELNRMLVLHYSDGQVVPLAGEDGPTIMGLAPEVDFSSLSTAETAQVADLGCPVG